MYQLYVNPPKSSWSLRPWILLKMLNIPFEQINVHYLADIHEQRKQFAQFSPTSKIPVLHTDGQIIWDSLAIVEFVAESYPQVWAQDKMARAWSRSVCAEIHSGFTQLREICNYDPLNVLPLKSVSNELAVELARIDKLWQEGLARFGGDYLAGSQFTAVDAFFVPIAGRIKTYDLASYFSQASIDYQQRLLALPPMAEWLGA